MDKEQQQRYTNEMKKQSTDNHSEPKETYHPYKTIRKLAPKQTQNLAENVGHKI